ncbi:hypothetical protein EAS64_37815 [Trebonia kvetii]|uniref:YCII-related domain-containing protein n=1 Tax=Trebonia kvetii TaxID=2480626 RepID=A0A6P2BSZ0_9ACTN|nr:YciI family protein [Trebonia kvetii]TVZ00393.1 hypothetical protein EAS64_37815 [Trebonia kvetii]
MQYLLIHTGAPDLAEAWDDQTWAALARWLDETISSGVNIEGSPLQLDADATTIKGRNGELIVTDGPYAETKEQVAGFDVIECAGMEEAVRWAGRHPHSWMGAVEVRALVGGAPAEHLPEPGAGKTRYLMLACTDPSVDPRESAMEPIGPWVAEMAAEACACSAASGGNEAPLWPDRYWRRARYSSWRLRILPVDVVGSSSANSTIRVRSRPGRPGATAT